MAIGVNETRGSKSHGRDYQDAGNAEGPIRE